MTGAGSIIIVGGGASGILLAAHLLRDPAARIRVTIIERRGRLGRGLAYAPGDAELILNVPARNMGAYADAPGHFLDWLRRRHPELGDDPWLFAPRRLYGDYLGELVRPADSASAGDARLTVVEDLAVAVRERSGGVEVELAGGTVHVGQTAVLAVGHEEQPTRGNGLATRVGSDADTPLDPDVPVMILGPGLSMVDAWLVLAARRHRGPVTIVSRHGLLPLAHRPVPPLTIDAADVPFGTNLRYLMRWLRRLVAEETTYGGDWRSVVDGLRPFNQRLWQSWTTATRRQFLEHARPYWNIHRHRLPPRQLDALRDAMASGAVSLIAGTVSGLERRGDQLSATVRRRGGREEAHAVARVYDCGGVTLDVRQSTNPVVLTLLRENKGRPDAHEIGLDVTPGLNVVAADGTPSTRLFAIGPLTRGQFFEIEAIPDIRNQAAMLAARLLG